METIKREALEEGYDIIIECNGWEHVIADKKLKEKIIKLIEKYEAI